jgi:hypothetical protein
MGKTTINYIKSFIFVDTRIPKNRLILSKLNGEVLNDDDAICVNRFVVESVKGPLFSKGDKFVDMNGQVGIVKYLRDDSHERKLRKGDPNHYYYYVEYDDSFETYYSEYFMRKIA